MRSKKIYYASDIKTYQSDIILKKYDELQNDIIPNNISNLGLCYVYNTINNLPISIKVLYNTSYIEYYYHDIYQYREIYKFNMTMNNLPKSIHFININCDGFNNSINNLLSGLITLNLNNRDFNKKLNNLPNNLTYFKLHVQYYNHKNINIKNFQNIKEINVITCNVNILNYNILSKSIKHLIIHHNSKINTNYLNNYNSGLNKLVFHNNSFNKNINNLPYSLKYFEFKCETPNNSRIKLQPNVTIVPYFTNYAIYNPYHLIFNYHNKEYFIEEPLPISLKILKLDFTYKGSLNILPNELNTLKLYEYFNELSNLPNSLKCLYLYRYYNSFDFLPESLEILKIVFFNNKINDLPASIKKIIITPSNEGKNMINSIYHSKIKITRKYML